jgi:hypothetical protein
MIMPHDAATSYYADKTCEGVATAESDWVMTQNPGTWTSQLNCGARAFDLRLLSNDGQLIAHHGSVDIKVKVSDLLNELKTWQGKNPNELVIVYGSHCTGDNCAKMFQDALSVASVPLLQCSQISRLTLGSALQIGSLLAVSGCVQENYDSSISCYGEGADEEPFELRQRPNYQPNSLFDNCHGSNSQQFFDALWDHVGKISDGRGKNQSDLWMAQAHWQYSASSIAQGTAMDSCILKDESEANVNSKLADKIVAGQFPHINFLEVDNVCDSDQSGMKLFAALRSRFTMDLDVDSIEAVV